MSKNRRRTWSVKKALLGLLLCFPYGLVMMWRRTRWHAAIKVAVTLCFVALTAAILVPMTNPPDRSLGGIQLVGVEKQVEVFGPKLPEAFAPVFQEDILVTGTGEDLFAEIDETPVVYVYANENGSYYHRMNCKYVAWYSVKMSVPQAFFNGYTPCAICEPSAYTPGMPG